MVNEVISIQNFFKLKHILLSSVWIESFLEWCKQEHDLPPNYTEKQAQEKVYEQWLLQDLQTLEIPALPPNLALEKCFTLNGVYCLQLMKVIDISKPKFWQIHQIRNSISKNADHENDFGKRVLQLTFTDGVQEIEAIEFRPISSLNINLPPGLKIRLTGPVKIRRGRIMLENNHIKILGGEVDELCVVNAAENILARALKLPENPNPNYINEKLLNTDNLANIEESADTPNLISNFSNQLRSYNINNGIINNGKLHTKVVSQEAVFSDNDFDIDDEMLLEAERNINKNEAVPKTICKSPDDLFEGCEFDDSCFNDLSLPSKSTIGNNSFSEKHDSKIIKKDDMKIVSESAFASKEHDLHKFIDICMVNELNGSFCQPVNNISIRELKRKTSTSCKFLIKAKFIEVVEKLTMSDNEFHLVIKVADDTDDTILRVHSDVTSTFAECTPRELMSYREKILNQDADAREKMLGVEDNCVDPEWTLLFYLREKLRLCGTKLGCGEGGCGACTVMVSKYDRKNNKVIHLPVNACLSPICAMHGLAVTTVEGIGSTKTKLHPVQERIAKSHGSQCGFCTPGIVMSMYTLLRNTSVPKMKDLDVAFQGNLCRCTGYRPIIEGFKTFTEEWELAQRGMKLNESTKQVCQMGKNCCKLQNGYTPKEVNGTSCNAYTNGKDAYNNHNGKINGFTTNETDNRKNGFDKKENKEILIEPHTFTPYHPSQEPIFPPELKTSDRYDQQYLIIRGRNVTWYRPLTLDELLKLKEKYPEAKIVVGNTEVGVETKFKHMVYPVIISPVQVQEITEISETETGVRVGASVTLDDMEKFLQIQIKKHPKEKTRIFQGIVGMLNWFAGKQIRSVGAIGSNIMTGSPISDMLPILVAIQAKLELRSYSDGLRTVTLDNNFFVGYRKSIVNPNEILFAIHIPFTEKNQYFKAYKQARRREDDIAIVNEAVNVTFEENSKIIRTINFGFGGMSFKVVSAPKTEEKLRGMPWNKETLETAYTWLLEDLPLSASAPGGMIQYRRSLTLSLFFKAFLAISYQLQQTVPEVQLHQSEISGMEIFHEKEYKSSQYYTVKADTGEKHDDLQKPIIHLSAYKQACGEAVYCDDLPHQEGELYIAFVTSTKAHAKILSVDFSGALAIDGVHGIVSGDDLPKERNFFGPIFHDENVFFNEIVTSQGQIIAGIVAKDQNTAQKAAKKVKVEYEEIQPIIVSIEDAIKYKSFYKDPHRVIEKGDVDEALKSAPHVLEGHCRMGGQEHFYLETVAVLAIPKPEDDELEIISSCQNPTEVAKLIGEVLNIPQNRIISKVKRIGGGFGGKESKTSIVAIPAAIAAKKFNRPIRCMLDRDEDMIMTGGRHPFMMKYKVGFDEHGKMLVCDVVLYCNAGYSFDLSPGVLDRAMAHVENAYNIPIVRVVGYLCKTNLASNTAFRGFGGPQGMYVAEAMAQDIALYLNKDPQIISEINLYQEDDYTYYNQRLENCTISKCWKECLTSSNYPERRLQIKEFNRKNKFKKRGLSIIPTKYGISFTTLHLNQGGALVLVYTDGSVLLHHGGIEIGQGLYTKMIQVASRALEIPVDKIHTSETSTDKVPNTSPTAASAASDLNGMAVMNACLKIKERLKPYKDANPNGTWEDLVKKAYFDRVSLSATGFYSVPNIGHNWDTNEGNLFSYFTYGVGCAEVEIDTLTGDHQVLRADIVMDLGESLNPAIDIGQIEGAFMQGYGLYVLEELMYSPTGTTYTRGPGTYKLPGFGDIPGEFNVSLLKGVSNPRAVYSSKAVGEPPLFLAYSVYQAIRDAIRSARIENGASQLFKLEAPATSAKIRMACQDNITCKLLEPEPGTFSPWNIEA